MAIASGLGASLGYSPEVSYGTFVAPTRFLELSKENLEKKKTVVQGSGLYAGKLGHRGRRRVVPTSWVEGSVALDLPSKGIGPILQALMGTTVTPVQQGATAAYLQTHTLADPLGKSLSFQVCLPNTAGTLYGKSVKGAKVTSGTFECTAEGVLTADFAVDGREYDDTVTPLTTASYTAGTNVFHGGQMKVKLGAHGSEAAVQGVTKVNVKIERPSNTKRYYANNAGAKAEPVINDVAKITGTIEADLVNRADFVDRFVNDTPTSLVWEFTGPTIAGAHAETFRITLPGISFDSGTPSIEGADVTSPSFGFTWNYDDANLPRIEVVSTETTI